MGSRDQRRGAAMVVSLALYHAAGTLIPSRKWKEAGDLYSEALNQQDHSDHTTRMLLFEGLAFSFINGGDYENCQKELLLAIDEGKNLNDGNLSVAKYFGYLAVTYAHDPIKAEAYYQRSLEYIDI